MEFLVITNAPTLKKNGLYQAYAPYVSEIDIWSKYVEKLTILSPTEYSGNLLIKTFKRQPNVVAIPTLNFTSFSYGLRSLFFLPLIVFKIFKACKKTDHIHLRCPGNIGLLGCLVQMCFPTKIKTAKYAGNWNSEEKQPLSYIIQRKILSNTFLTKNMSVLVYGKWKNQTKNIKSFFTATYFKDEIVPNTPKNYNDYLHFLFAGSLVEGKRPLFTIKLIQSLQNSGINCRLDVFGDGLLKEKLQSYININDLKNITLHGNKSREIIKGYLQKSHFSILASKSEGWPKAVAEAMFYGVIPIATKVSCIPFMLDYGKRGILIEPKLDIALQTIKEKLLETAQLIEQSKKAQLWSQQYTLEYFESEIKTLLEQ